MSTPRARSVATRWAAWGLPPLVAGLVGGALWLAFRTPASLAPAVLGLLLAGMILWIATSILWPARADRTCPICSARALERTDPARAEGLRCSACGWRDDEASGWFLAEEEMDALEPLTLERRRRGATGGAAAPPAPDTPADAPMDSRGATH